MRLFELRHVQMAALYPSLAVRAAIRSVRIATCAAIIVASLVYITGCAARKFGSANLSKPPAQEPIAKAAIPAPSKPLPTVLLVSHHQQHEAATADPLPDPQIPDSLTLFDQHAESLIELESIAVASNPTLRRMQQEAAAEWAKTRYVSKLPDPTIASMFYTPPMNFDPDRQLAEVQVMQMIPWLGRLQAEARRAHVEALVAQTQYQAERLRVVGDIRVTWYKLYVLGKQIETTEADRAQLESLVRTANARVRTGDAQPGDVLLATLELSSIQEQLLGYRQQVVASIAELNRLIGRDIITPITPPATIDVELPPWNYELLRQTALQTQPELNAARLQSAATRWGIEVARLKRRPDLTFGVGWVAMDAPGATAPEAGRDSVTLGVTASVPIWHRKYDAMTSEASREHLAARAGEEEVTLRLDAMLRDLWEMAVASQRTVELYENSILPQARQTFEADQKSLINNAVTFDRVIRDYRTLLNLQLGYHRALGQLATTLARIRQAVGVDELSSPVMP
jgi:cobalt-zinc-cadmium efflux system outer membrane protein